MATRPPLHAVSPRAKAHGFPPSTVPSPARPHSAKPTSSCRSVTSTSTPFPPQRPQSASRVRTTPTNATNAAFRSRAQVGFVMAQSTGAASSPRRRPASASRVRATFTTSTLARADAAEEDDVDTITFSTPRAQWEPTEEHHGDAHAAEGGDGDATTPVAPASPLQQQNRVPIDRAAIAQAEQFLMSWQREEASFRSPLLYAESSFAHAKAMTAVEWPHPNVFLSSVAFGSLELFCQSLERHHPFLPQLLDAIGMALFTNHMELHNTPHGTAQPWNNKFLHYMQHGRFCFQQLHAHDEQLHLWRSAAQKAKKEVAQLNTKLQKQHVARLFERVQARVKSAAMATSITSDNESLNDSNPYPQLRRVLYGDERGAHFDLQADDYDFEPSCDEILLFFSSLPRAEALRLLSLMHVKAAELQLPRMGEQYAMAVDMLSETERRSFLREYFQLVSSEELQDALQHRDESNQEKQWQTFLDEMKDVLRIDDVSPSDPVVAQSRLQSFHSSEARIGDKIYDLVDLVEELAAEVSLADEKKPLRLSTELQARLKPYQTAKKKMEKARKMMMAKPENVQPPLEFPITCGCVCGQHRLVNIRDSQTTHEVIRAEHPPATAEDGDGQPEEDTTEDLVMKKKKRPSSAQRRPSSARSGNRRKSSASARVSSRGSLPMRLFPMSEVCHLVSSVVQLQFSRDAADGPAARRGSTRRDSRSGGASAVISSLSVDQRLSFKALAKDLLTRKYGIKSIAVMHLVQLERSLVHYAATEGHARCDLFAWFVGTDKTRSFYKDVAYQFYLRVVKSVMAILLKKPLTALTYADHIAVWNEQIGDADTSAGTGIVAPKLLSITQCVEICSLAFPSWMKESAAYTTQVIKCFQSVTGSVEMERFFKRVMAVWESQFVKLHAEIEESFMNATAPGTDELDRSLFHKCVAASGLELSSGEVLEQFDRLSCDGNAYVTRKKAVLFVIERKYPG